MADYVSSRQDFTVITMIEEVLSDDPQVERFQDLWQLRVRLQKMEGRSQGLSNSTEYALNFQLSYISTPI